MDARLSSCLKSLQSTSSAASQPLTYSDGTTTCWAPIPPASTSRARPREWLRGGRDSSVSRTVSVLTACRPILLADSFASWRASATQPPGTAQGLISGGASLQLVRACKCERARRSRSARPCGKCLNSASELQLNKNKE